MPEQKFLGKFEATVINNIDPMQLGRIQVQTPEASGITLSSWATPCCPYTGKQMGACMIPQVGSSVWIEFQGGNLDRPIWTGGFYGSAAEVPSLALAGVPASPNILLQSAAQNTFMISDIPGPTGGLMLKSATGASIIVNDTGIYIQNGKGASIVLTGPTVNINNGPFTVI